MDVLRVRVYDVGFGDAVLVSVPERMPDGSTEVRHMLVDFGTLCSSPGSEGAIYERVMRDLQAVLGERPLDLYLMTHAHLDHVEGLLYAAEKLKLPLRTRFAWLTASAAAEYSRRFEEAGKRMVAARKSMLLNSRLCELIPEAVEPFHQVLLFNNDAAMMERCVRHLQGLADNTAYVYRGCSLEDKHPFQEARLSIWAPEEDLTRYYGAFHSWMKHKQNGNASLPVSFRDVPDPPPGVDAGAFYNLVLRMRRKACMDELLEIDNDLNNTSVVFCLEWRGWKLLFLGDVGPESWLAMLEAGVFAPVHFVKVSHHGSARGAPKPRMLDKILPPAPPDGRRRVAVVSTGAGIYEGVPNPDSLKAWADRCTVRSVLTDTGEAGYLDVEFPDDLTHEVSHTVEGPPA